MMTRALRDGLKLLRDAGGVLGWILATAWLGGRVVWRAGVLASRWKQIFAQTTRCPRGHRVALYGAHQCSACRAATEGYIFRPCRFCGSTPSWIECPRCHLGVPNPMR